MTLFRFQPVARAARRLLPFLLLGMAPGVRAESITYNITLAASAGGPEGTGTLTLANTPSASGTSTFSTSNGGLQNLSFTIGDQTFFLSGDPSATVQFVDGKVSEINFIQTVDQAPLRHTLELSEGYKFYGNDFGHPLSSGSFAVAPEVTAMPTERAAPQAAAPVSAATPEPAGLVLLATGLLGLGFLLSRKKTAEQS